MNRRFASRHCGVWHHLLVFIMSIVVAGGAEAGKVETWTQQGTNLGSGEKERVVGSDAGRIRLGRVVSDQPEGLTASQVWDLALGKDGTLYAATGNEGKVWRRAAGGNWEIAIDLTDTQALCLAATPDGRLHVGTGPGGRIVTLGDGDEAGSRPGPDVQYVWDLAATADGTLFAATGPAGQLWKRPPGGQWLLVLDSRYPHILSVSGSPDGSIYAGSDGEGLIYRVDPAGKVEVLFDAPAAEIRALIVAEDGAVFAGTAAPETGGSARSVTTASALPSDRNVEQTTFAQVPGGSATPKALGGGENAVYRIGEDRVAREVFRAKALIYSLAWQDGRLLVGTGPEGRLFEVIDLGRESTSIARLDPGQILAILANDDGSAWLGTGSPGKVLRLESGHPPDGLLTSTVLDTKLVSRFGSLDWQGDTPAGTRLALQLRSGNVGEPDETWSGWSQPLCRPGDAPVDVPPGRFAQFRARMTTSDRKLSPELRSVQLRYKTQNLPPEIGKIEVPERGGESSNPASTLNLKWNASDPNGDELAYILELRKAEWPGWIRISGPKPLAEASLAWDSTSVPSGTYRVRVTAADERSNPRTEALSRSLESEEFLIDHEPPAVAIASEGAGRLAITTEDTHGRLVKAAYAIDGGDWIAVFPDDGLFDSKHERLSIELPELGDGTHLIRARAIDTSGNTGAGDLVIEAK